MCSLPTRIGSAAHSAWGHASAEDDDLAWLAKAKAKAKAKAGPRLQTNGGSPIAIASLAAIAGMFIMMDSRAGDQRLVLAGQWPGSLLAARLALIALIALAAMVATTISLAITAAVADVRQWGLHCRQPARCRYLRPHRRASSPEDHCPIRLLRRRRRRDRHRGPVGHDP
jgi:hypothetical protein